MAKKMIMISIRKGDTFKNTMGNKVKVTDVNKSEAILESETGKVYRMDLKELESVIRRERYTNYKSVSYEIF